jgi:hypothetical protein
MTSINESDIRNIGRDIVGGVFTKGMYHGVEIVIDNSTGYVNGHLLIDRLSSDKSSMRSFAQWKVSSGAKSLIAYLGALHNDYAIIIENTEGPPEARGAYIHPELVPHLAQWISPLFARKMSLLINSSALTKPKLDSPDPISDLACLTATIRRQSAQLEGLAEEIRSIRQENSNILSQLDIITSEAENHTTDNIELAQRVEAIMGSMAIPYE